MDFAAWWDWLLTHAAATWVGGGWGMPAIAATAALMFGLGVHCWLDLRALGLGKVPESRWHGWIDQPAERSGHIGKLLDFVGGNATVKDMGEAFRELRIIEIAPFRRHLRLMKVCVGAAPLLGLLGTVTGMLSTFAALATGSGGDQTMGLIAEGIRVALITTETGLVVALPGLFFQSQLALRLDNYASFLMHLEVACTQELYRRLQARKSA